MPARPILVGGTASHVGKSWMAAAICRHVRRRGFRVAPFKAQNMSNNSYPCREGGEIGRAQVVQAEACGLAPAPDMNPILLKPNADSNCQVVVNGKAWRNLDARAYYDHFDFLLGQALEAYQRLACKYEYIVIEGAGSIAELNLRSRDLVNLGLATRIGAPVLLVADIDRGGVFASIVGTLALLEPAEAALVRSFAVNRFRGDPSLFEDGVRILEEKAARRCLGVFPFARDVRIDEEDGVYLEEAVRAARRPSAIAIIRFPRISNLTDFRLLPDARWIEAPVEDRFEWVILPGTKSTIADLDWLRAQGLDEWLVRQKAAGARILGICGGYQMLGERVEDPDAVESAAGARDGLGLLPVRTVLRRVKTTEVVEAVTPQGRRFRAYEIHMGETLRPAGCAPFALVASGDEGIRSGGSVGTYLHGALEDRGVLEELLGRPVAAAPPKEEMYERLGDWFERHADLGLFEELYL